MGLDGQHTAGSGFIESFDSRYPTRVLETLLKDRTTGHNIIWADSEYEALGDGYMGDDEITVDKITGLSSGVIKPRIAKEQEHRSQRTRTRAEVFTPSWLCNRMNNDIDATWFGTRDVFNVEDGQEWITTSEPITFPRAKGHGWHAYVESPRMEITCGEAPFVCSRYDTVFGNPLPVGDRIGFLDRKLRVVTEKTKTRKEWVRRALMALKASYGFEYQGDNLLLARINVFETFCEHLWERWGAGLTDEEMDQAAWIVSWNFWQMNGLTCAVPTNKMDAIVQSALPSYEEPAPEPMQLSLFDLLDDLPLDETAGETEADASEKTVPLCVIYNWQENEPFEFVSLKGKACPMDKKFYAVIGNPPYQETVEGTSDKPIYNYFMDESYGVGEHVELITPSRFLFNAGKTPKAWNRKMLADPHLEVLKYEQVSSSVFPNTDIKGGVAITLRNVDKESGPIEVFTPFEELCTIRKKVVSDLRLGCMTDLMYLQERFNLNELYRDYPEAPEIISSGGRERRIVTSSFNKLAVFSDLQQTEDSVRILGLSQPGNRRVYK
mgnify:FL=1